MKLIHVQTEIFFGEFIKGYVSLKNRQTNDYNFMFIDNSITFDVDEPNDRQEYDIIYASSDAGRYCHAICGNVRQTHSPGKLARKYSLVISVKCLVCC